MPSAADVARRARFHRIARRLDGFELQGEALAQPLSEAEVLRELREPRRGTRVLGYYSAQGIERAFERYGLLPQLRARGFGELRLTVDPSDPARQLVRIRGARPGATLVLLLELVVRRRALVTAVGPVEVLFVEWLLLQDPTAGFTPERPRMPGQEHPGLGLARDVERVLVQACERLGLDGVASQPAHYHTALEASAESRFLDAEAEGRFRALRAALAGRELVEAAWLVAESRVRTADGRTLAWEPSERALPASARLRALLSSPAYETRAVLACRGWLCAGLRVEPPRA